MLWNVMRCYEMLWDVLQSHCQHLSLKPPRPVQWSLGVVGLPEGKGIWAAGFYFDHSSSVFQFQKKKYMSHVPTIRTFIDIKKKIIHWEFSRCVFQTPVFLLTKGSSELNSGKKKSVNMSYLKVQPTNLSILSSYSKNSRKTPISAASMAHLLSGGALAGRLRMTTWRWRGSSPFKGVVLGSP